MTTQDDCRDLIALQKQLATLHGDLMESLERTRKRARGTFAAAILLLLLVVCYCSYIYTQIARIDAESVAFWAQGRTVQLVTESRPAVTQAVKDRAPEVFDYLEARALETPAIISNKLRDVSLERTQLLLDQSEPVLTKLVLDSIDQAKTSTMAAGFNGKDPAQMDKVIDALVARLHAGVRDGVDKLYVDYDAKAGEVTRYIDRLAAGKDLTDREQHLRQVIISFLAIDRKQKMN